MLLRIGALLLTLLVAACNTVPRPFQPDDKRAAASAILLAPDSRSSLFLAPVIGAPYPFGDIMNEQLASALQKLDIAATTRNPSQLSAILQGTMDNAGGQWRIRWQMVDPRGLVSGSTETRISERDIEYAKAYPETLTVFSQRFALEISRLIRGEASAGFDGGIEPPAATASPASAPAAAAPAAPQGRQALSIYIKPIADAPGDGGGALLTTLTQLMRQRGVTTPAEATPSSLQLQISVRLTDQGTQNQLVEIIWDLQSPEGQSLGQSVQRNVIRRGELDGAWGGRAYAIAEAGLEGLQQIILRLGDQIQRRVQP